MCPPPRLQQPFREHVPPVRIGAHLDFVDGKEIDRPVQWHGLDRAQEITRPFGQDLFLAGDQRDLALAFLLDRPVIVFPRQQAQGKADDAGRIGQQAVHRQMGLPRIGRAEDGDDALALRGEFHDPLNVAPSAARRKGVTPPLFP